MQAKVLAVEVFSSNELKYQFQVYEFDNGLILYTSFTSSSHLSIVFRGREDLRAIEDKSVVSINETGKSVNLSFADIEKAIGSSIKFFERGSASLGLIKEREDAIAKKQDN